MLSGNISNIAWTSLRLLKIKAPLDGDTSLMLYGTGLFEKEVVELLASVLNFA